MRHVIVHAGVPLAAVLAALAGCVYVVETPCGPCMCEVEDEPPDDDHPHPLEHEWSFEYNAG